MHAKTSEYRDQVHRLKSAQEDTAKEHAVVVKDLNAQILQIETGNKEV